MRRTIKMKYSTPREVEGVLINKYGYHVQKRIFQEYTIFVKLANPNTGNVIVPKQAEALVHYADQVLTDPEKTALLKRCDNIVDHFIEPYDPKIFWAVRARLNNMAQTLKPVERAVIEDYMEENFPLPDESGTC